jgi:hypothetical protein
MALEVLKGIIRNEPVQRDVHHDLESFLWVIIYAIYRHTLADAKHQQNKELQTEFKEYFGKTTLRELARRPFTEFGAEVLVKISGREEKLLLHDSTLMIRAQNPRRELDTEKYRGDMGDLEMESSPIPEPVKITYGKVIKMLRKIVPEKQKNSAQSVSNLK